MTRACAISEFGNGVIDSGILDLQMYVIGESIGVTAGAIRLVG